MLAIERTAKPESVTAAYLEVRKQTLHVDTIGSVEVSLISQSNNSVVQVQNRLVSPEVGGLTEKRDVIRSPVRLQYISL